MGDRSARPRQLRDSRRPVHHRESVVLPAARHRPGADLAGRRARGGVLRGDAGPAPGRQRQYRGQRPRSGSRPTAASPCSTGIGKASPGAVLTSSGLTAARSSPLTTPARSPESATGSPATSWWCWPAALLAGDGVIILAHGMRQRVTWTEEALAVRECPLQQCERIGRPTGRMVSVGQIAAQRDGVRVAGTV